MRIPKTLKIQGKIWTIVRQNDLLEKENLMGICLFGPRLIKIDSTQTLRDQKITFIHEVLHAMWPRDTRSEERIIEHIDGELYDILMNLKKGPVCQTRKRKKPRRKKK